jgi:putative hydrolase of the HAD superfamily
MSGSGRRYEAVFWDIGGVIVELASVREGYAAFVAELADERDLDAESALETWKTALGDHFRGRDGTEYRTAREGYRKATAALFDGGPPDGWRDRLDRATSATLRAEPGAVETIERLADAGLEQAIVSDIDTREAEDMLASFGVREYFDHVTTSEAVGHTKPDERVFRDALSATGADPGDVLMVGDRYDHDVAGAAAVGIDAAGYGKDAWGPEATCEITDLRKLPDVVGLRGEGN